MIAQPPVTTAQADAARRRRTRIGVAIGALLWFALVRNTLVVVLDAPQPLVVGGVVGLVGSAALFGWVVVRHRTRRPRRAVGRAVLGAQLAFALLTCAAAAEDGLIGFVLLCLSAMYLVPRTQAAWLVAVTVVAMVALPRVLPGWHPADGNAITAALGGVATFAMLQGMERNRLLLRAQEEVAALATFRERERITRDMHDVLGHSLTVISVKAELAARLLRAGAGGAGIGRAADELADVQSLARSALADVRGMIADERRVSLAGEVAAARAALDAAGIDADLPGAVDMVPAERRELFAWVLREGSTNVLRHAGARHVRVDLTPDTLVIEDDGQGQVVGESSGGHGLNGLGARAHAAGATLEHGPRPGGGFRLAATYAGPA
ncbi:sensor histidine kinase [Promicromonospora xylanilytica]